MVSLAVFFIILVTDKQARLVSHHYVDPKHNEQTELNNDDLYDETTFRPWTTVVRGRSTFTANIYDIQHDLIQEKKAAIDRDDIAKALHERNLLRQTKVIQISPNLKYVSIQFHTSMLMETFCTNPLTVKNFTITFTPDFKKKQRQLCETEVMSFLNVPSEAEKEAVIQFIQPCATVVGQPRYPTKTLGEIEYYTGTRIYRVHSRKELIPQQITLFGRQIRCMYTKQPEYLAWLEHTRHR